MASPTRIVVMTIIIAAGSVVEPGGALMGQRPLDQRDKPPVLTAFTINGGADSVAVSAPFVTLVHTIVGARPTEYRVSHRADFAGALWVSYLLAPVVRDWY